MTNLIKIARSVAMKANRNSLNDYLLIGDKLISELTASALDPKREEILSSIAYLEDDKKLYSALVHQDSALVTALPLICLPTFILIRKYDFPNQDLYYGFMNGVILVIIIRTILNIKRRAVSFYALGALTQLADKNLRE